MGVGVGIISEGLLCQKSTGRIRIERIKNAHLSRSVPDKRNNKLSTEMAVQTTALKHVVGLYSRVTWETGNVSALAAEEERNIR